MKEFKDLSRSLEILAEGLYDKVVDEAKKAIAAKNVEIEKSAVEKEVEMVFDSLTDHERMVMYCHQVLFLGKDSDITQYDENYTRRVAIEALADTIIDDAKE